MPTHENYPDDAHTRVIYHSPRGHIQNYGQVHQSNAVTLPAKLPSNRYLYKPAPAKHSSYQPPVNQQYYDNSKQEAFYAPSGHQMKTNTIYTDANGQSYIYVLPSQLGHLQDYYSQGYEQEQEHHEQHESVQTEAPFNYHAHQAKYQVERSKKSSGRPVMFEDTPPKQ